jgi:hypothetical protein
VARKPSQRQQLLALKAERETLALEAELASLRESVHWQRTIQSVVREAATMVDTRGYLSDDPSFGGYNESYLTARVEDYRDGDFYPHFRTEQELADIRGNARYLSTLNEVAISARENLRNYVIGEGVDILAAPRKAYRKSPEAKEYAGKAQAAIERILSACNWYGNLEFEAFDNLVIDGEWFLYIGAREGEPCIELLDASRVTEPGDPAKVASYAGVAQSLNWKYGVATHPERTNQPKAYFVCGVSSATEWEAYNTDELLHFKQNTPSQVKRGLSDFKAVSDTIDKAAKVLNNTTVGAAVQASIAYIRQHAPTITPGQIGSFVSARSDATDLQTTSKGVRSINSRRALPGTVVDIPNGMQYQAGPMGSSQSGVYLEVFKAAIRVLGIRWQMPEYMISGDASNANYASTLVAGSPFVRAARSRQYRIEQAYRRIGLRIVKVACQVGMLDFTYDDFIAVCEVTAQGNEIAIGNDAQELSRRQMLNDKGLLSLETWASKEGLDYAEEQNQPSMRKAQELSPPPTPKPAQMAESVWKQWTGYP